MSSSDFKRFYEGKELALDYDRYRPTYPTFIVDKVLEYMRSQNPDKLSQKRFSRMLDVGCGGGKSTKLFAPHFDSILGIDISESQIDVAKVKSDHDNVTFQLVLDNYFPVEDNSIDLINCATAIHFVDVKVFESECMRVLKPNGCVAAFHYYPWSLGPEFDSEAKLIESYKRFSIASGSKPLVKLHQDVYELIKNKTKMWIEGAMFYDQYYKLTEYKKYLTTLGHYRQLMENSGTQKDPMNDHIDDIKSLLKAEILNDEEVEFNITFIFPMFVFHKE